MVRSAGSTVAIAGLLVVLAVGCGARETTVPLGPLLSGGEFVPTDRVADLVADVGERDDPVFWLPRPVLPVDGWGRALRGWRPVGASSTLDLSRHEPGPAALVYEFRRRRSATGQLRVTTRVDGAEVGSAALGPGRTLGRHPLPAATAGAVHRVEFRFEPPLRQPEVGAVELSLTRVGLESPAADRGRPPRRGPSVLVDLDAAALTFRASGVYLLPLSIPPTAGRIAYELRAPAAGALGTEAAIRLWALDPEGVRHRLEPSGGEADGSGWSERAAAIEELRGRDVFLGIEARVAEPGSRVAVRNLRLTAAGEPPEPPPAAATDTSGPRPDIVLIVLDAARADRLDGRYPRDVTPNLDAIHPESLVFEHTYADCPNTVCSMPNLITGRSLLDTGDVYSGVKLADEVVTLAEILRGAGYRTVGLSANPNNSATRNQHQGFDDWRELWGREHRDALQMSELATEIVAGQPADRPLYLQLHYLPPHQPYAPPPEFDLYTDPDYRGPVRPKKPLDLPEHRPATLPPADLSQLIGLYDGNVRLADAAVGRVLEALRATGRWADTLLIVTSDHGEAFLEHGYHGHNSTLFDEMLHVPLIVRLPAGERPEGVDTGRLAALSDVVPTVLGRLELEPAPEVDGVDLLSTRAHARRPRVIFHRTNHKRPLFATHTRRWKLIVRPALEERMLFDLAEDPGETVNLAAARPWMYTGLGLLLRRRLDARAQPSLGAIPVELGEDERAVLESLGYVDRP